jgi:SAM-dependent methyltransferase
VMRHWKNLEGPVLYGTDVNPRLIQWCTYHLGFAHFARHALKGPLPFEAESFDLVYALSVLTHLSSSLQDSWMKELSRVLRPGGLLFLTLHGEAYLERLRFAEAEEFRQGRLVVRGEDAEGRNRCAAFHPESYVRTHLSRDFELLEFVAQGAKGNPTQDVYLLRKPVGA